MKNPNAIWFQKKTLKTYPLTHEESALLAQVCLVNDQYHFQIYWNGIDYRSHGILLHEGQSATLPLAKQQVFQFLESRNSVS
jgi:hypothetical protein